MGYVAPQNALNQNSHSLRTRIAVAAPAIAAALGGAAYLMELAEFYPWWIVVLVTPLALLGAMIAFCFIWLPAESPMLRVLWLAVGIGGIATGLTAPDGLGTFLMGCAFILVAAFPDPATPADRSRNAPSKDPSV